MIITNEEQYKKGGGNGASPKFTNSKIEVCEGNNFIYCEEGVRLNNCSIILKGEGNIVYLRKSYYPYYLKATLYNNSVFYMDENNYMGGILNVLVQEHQNVLIGRGNFLSYGIYMMTGDAHLIYEIKTKTRINKSKSILLGDHVWIGQFCKVLKGTCMGSGAILGGNSVISGKKCSSNTIWAGNPAKEIKGGVFWKTDCTNMYDESKTEEMMICEDESDIFQRDDYCIDIINMDLNLKKSNMTEKINLLRVIESCDAKNRFFCES